MQKLVAKLALATLIASSWTAQALAFAKSPEGGGYSSGSAPEIDGPAGLAAIAMVAAVGLYLYNRGRK